MSKFKVGDIIKKINSEDYNILTVSYNRNVRCRINSVSASKYTFLDIEKDRLDWGFIRNIDILYELDVQYIREQRLKKLLS